MKDETTVVGDMNTRNIPRRDHSIAIRSDRHVTLEPTPMNSILLNGDKIYLRSQLENTSRQRK